MSPSKRLSPLKRIAENKEQLAARKFGLAQKHLAEQQQKLDELKTYHQQYLEQYERSGRGGISVSRLQEYQAFLAKLRLAIEQQTEVVARTHAQNQVIKQDWQKKNTRTRIMSKVVENHQIKERKGADRSEQKIADDRSSNFNPHS